MDLRTRHFAQEPRLDCEAVTRHAVFKIDELPASVLALPTGMLT